MPLCRHCARTDADRTLLSPAAHRHREAPARGGTGRDEGYWGPPRAEQSTRRSFFRVVPTCCAADVSMIRGSSLQLNTIPGARSSALRRERDECTWWSQRRDLRDDCATALGASHAGNVKIGNLACAGMPAENERNKHFARGILGRREHCEHASMRTANWQWRGFGGSGRLLLTLLFVLLCEVVGSSEGDGDAFSAMDNDTHLREASTVHMKSYPSRIDRYFGTCRASIVGAL